jgi:hypothetical protein
MAFDPAVMYKFMETSYRLGVLDKILTIQGQALDEVVAEKNLSMADFLERMDEASERTVVKIDKMLDKSKLPLKIASNEWMMRLTSRILDYPSVKRLLINITKRYLLKTITGQAPSPLKERV